MSNSLDFNSILTEIGPFGFGQKIQYGCLSCLVFFVGLIALDFVIVLGSPEFYCDISNSTQEKFLNSLAESVNGNLTLSEQLKWLQPKNSKGEINQCEMYNVSQLIKATQNVTDWSSAQALQRIEMLIKHVPRIACKRWNFRTDVFKSTAVEEFSLVCDKAWTKTAMKSSFFLGRFFGALLIGQLADWIGRLPALMLCVILDALTGFGIGFANTPILLAISYAIQGVSQIGMMLVVFVLANEMIGTEKRKFSGILIQCFFAAAYALIPWIYKLMPNYRSFGMLIRFPVIIYLPLYFFLHESPLWLLSKGRAKEALKIVESVARLNGHNLSTESRSAILREGSRNAVALINEDKEENKDDDSIEKAKKKYSIIDLFRKPSLALITLNVCYNWFVNSYVYYGATMNAENLGGDFYLNMSIMGLLEFPAYFLTIYFCDKLGRKKILIGSLALAGLSCLATGFINKDPVWLLVLSAMFGKFGITISFAMIYFYTTELFPTVVRTSGMGLGSMTARIGGISTAPTLALADSLWAPLPFLIFGATSLLASILAFLLPETANKPLAQTLSDMHLEMPCHNCVTKSPTREKEEEAASDCEANSMI